MLYWVFRRASDSSFPEDSTPPSITFLPTKSVNNFVVINLSEPIDYQTSWSMLLEHKYALMIKCGNDVFYGALQEPGPYDALIFKTMELPAVNCTATLRGSIQDFNGNVLVLNKTWSLTGK